MSILIINRLPFQEEYSAGLGILTKTYFDELGVSEDPPEKKHQDLIMEKTGKWLIYTNVPGSLGLALQLWDAVYNGVKSSDDKIIKEEDRKLWGEVDSWLDPRRQSI